MSETKPDLPALRDVLARLERATGPDRELERFWKYVAPEPNSGCWLWTGAAMTPLGPRPRGVFHCLGEKLAHRVAYVLFKGPIDAGKLICHHCDNSICVNPDHLYSGTHAQNMADMGARGRSYFAKCPDVARAAGAVLGASNDWSKGESNGRAKLTSSKVADIRAALAKGAEKKALGKVYGVNERTIRRIGRGEIWPSSSPPSAR